MKAILAPCALALLLGFPAEALNAAQTPPICRGKDLTQLASFASSRAKRADELLNADGIFWRIDKPGLEASYLYGTIHSTDDAAVALARRAAERIGGAKVVATELGGPMDAAEIARGAGRP